MPDIKTSDLIDKYDSELRFCNVPLQLYGRRRFFQGKIVTVRAFEDNVLLRRFLESDGAGKVLVVDGGGLTRRALVGDIIVELGMKNGWEGLILNGALRDAIEISELAFGVFALGRTPKRSYKTGAGESNVPVNFGGIDFVPGEMVYADDDGILVSSRSLVESMIAAQDTAKARECT